jgi:radical SAM protein with 4Fe4S-binding SPASM domain
MPRARITERDAAPSPRYVVWELTLKCDLACRHCGSRAGRPRAEELSIEECRDLARQLADMGAEEVTLIGGEAYLAPRWLEVVAAVRDAGIRCTMTTGGRALDADMARAAADAGLNGVSLSIDGLEATHDQLRAVKGSWRAAVAGLGHVHAAGIETYANTQVNQLNLGELEALAEHLLAGGVRAWQVQLTGPMGRAADRPEILLQPYQMRTFVPRLGALAERLKPRGLEIQIANNLGYYGAWEHILRPVPWQGCAAGIGVLGIESNGDIKGCPSLPSAPYVGGNVRDRPLAEIWAETPELRFARERGTSELWGHCGECYYASLCRAGCSWTSHTLLGRRGNMPYCHHRAETLHARGIRERIEKVEAAPGAPFDFGRYRLVEEPVP